MRRLASLFVTLCIGVFLPAGTCHAAENAVFSGRIVDVSGKPVPGAEVFVYTVSNIRRPPDFIAPPANELGQFRIIVPPGRYWTVARLRQGREKYGPLLPGDKHSGAPVEFDITSGEQLEEEFTVADLEETSSLTVKLDTSFIKVEGILSASGQPVENAYAYANRQEGFKKIPDFVSAWTDSSGRYTLFLPPGIYYVGLAGEFPPDPAKAGPRREIAVDSDSRNFDILLEK